MFCHDYQTSFLHRIQCVSFLHYKQNKGLLRKLMLTKCEVSPLCQNITYISRKGMGDRVSRPVLIKTWVDIHIENSLSSIQFQLVSKIPMNSINHFMAFLRKLGGAITSDITSYTAFPTLPIPILDKPIISIRGARALGAPLCMSHCIGIWLISWEVSRMCCSFYWYLHKSNRV